MWRRWEVEQETYRKIVEKYANIVFRTAYSYCKNRSDAEDIVQNTFLKLLTGTYEFRDEEHLRKWLIRVTVNQAKNLHLSFWKQKVLPLECSEAEPNPQFETEEQSRLFDAVRELPPKYRIVVHLYYYEEYSVKEIAQILKIRETTVQTQLMRARNKLKSRLEEWQNEQ